MKPGSVSERSDLRRKLLERGFIKANREVSHGDVLTMPLFVGSRLAFFEVMR